MSASSSIWGDQSCVHACLRARPRASLRYVRDGRGDCSGRRHAGGGHAFEVLVEQSQRRNVRVTVLAVEVVEVVGILPRR